MLLDSNTSSDIFLTSLFYNYHLCDSRTTMDLKVKNPISKLLVTAGDRGISSQLYQLLELSESGTKIITSIKRQLQSLSILAASRNKLLLSEYSSIKKLLQKNSVNFYPLKGIWLLENVYPAGYPRLTSDMDILVQTDDIKKLIDLSHVMGYIQDPVRSRFDSHISKIPGHHIMPVRKNGISIEWHIKPFPSAPDSFTTTLLHNNNSKLAHLYVIIRHFLRHWQAGDHQLKWLFDILLLSSRISSSRFLACIKNDIDDNISPQYLDFIEQIFSLHASSHIREEIIILINMINRIVTQTPKQQLSFFNNLANTKEKMWWVMGTIFPSAAYLNFQNVHNTKRPLILLLINRWLRLINKTIHLLFGKLIRL